MTTDLKASRKKEGHLKADDFFEQINLLQQV
jgi:hypothetical protein